MFNTAQRICVFGLTIFGLAGLALAQTTTPPPAPSPEVRTSGMVGLTAGQTARLNVLNPGLSVPAATGTVCPALLSFLNDQGVVVTTSTVSVMPGKSAYLDLDRDTAISTTDLRVEIRAAFAMPVAAPSTCRLIPTMEVFNNSTGMTQLVVGHFPRISQPTPTPTPVSTTP